MSSSCWSIARTCSIPAPRMASRRCEPWPGAAQSRRTTIRSATRRPSANGRSRTPKTTTGGETDVSQDPALEGLAGRIVHDEVVPARAPWSHVVRRGETLRIVDLEGNQAVDFLVYSLADDAERYSAQDTIAAQGNIFLRPGSVLLSNEGASMMTLTGTSVAWHDTIGGACSCESNTLRYGHHTKAQHACVDNFLFANADWGRNKRDLVS